MTMRKQQGSKRGRPAADPIDRLRAKLWYWAVKARGDWSDYRLDVEFVRDEGEEKKDGSSRRRSFERVRRDGTVPSSGTHRTRKYDLIARVDAHPNFAGTAAIFRSPFWDLLKGNAMRLSEVNTFVCQCMSKQKIIRPTFKLNRPLIVEAEWEPEFVCTDAQRYKIALTAICQGKPIDLDFLGLIGGLFWEAYLACELDIAIILRDKFSDLFEQFCNQDWLSKARSELLEFVEQRMLYRGIESNLIWGGAGYDDLPNAVVSRPLFPLNDATMRIIQSQLKR